nr:hypothetical protein [uncultured Pseudomonas sp.]
MSIQTKNWTARINRMPGDSFFRTSGIVTVAHPGVTPKLVMTQVQDASHHLRLELILENSNENTLQVLTEKAVEYKTLGNSDVTGVSIYYKNERISHITNITITH